ncbi:MAG: hypothetical protein ACLFTY_01965 [Candidatus Aenigmatarchaeota archaeon]
MFLSTEGQASTEYLMIMIIAMLILIPLVSLVYSQTARSREDMGKAALRDSLQSLADSADMVQAQGYPARITKSLHLPSGTSRTNVTQNHFVVRVESASGPTDYSAETSANLTGDLPVKPGSYKITLKMEEEGFVNVTF